MIPDFKTYIRESVWADLHSRGIGELEREEDDVNLLDRQEMVEYIKTHYNINDNKYHPHVTGNVLCVPIIMWENVDGVEVNCLFYDYVDNVVYVTKKIHKGTYKKIKSNPLYSTAIYCEGFYSIDPKNGEVNNRFFLEVIDFILHIITKGVLPMLSKKDVNESVWADLHSRGIGETEREEDEFFDLESLKEYIDNKIKTTTGDTLDLRNLDLSNLDSLKYENIIFDLIGYKQIKIIDVTGWKTSTIKNMSGVFDWCRNVEKIKGLETWDVSNVKDMSYMFSCCSSLTDINIERWKVDKVMNMEYMFYKCKSLKKLNLEHWNIDATTDYMFYECGTNFRPSWYK